MWECHIYDPSSTRVIRSERDITAVWEYHNTTLAVQGLTDHRVTHSYVDISYIGPQP